MVKYIYLGVSILGMVGVIGGLLAEDYRLVGMNAFFAACNAFIAGREWE